MALFEACSVFTRITACLLADLLSRLLAPEASAALVAKHVCSGCDRRSESCRVGFLTSTLKSSALHGALICPGQRSTNIDQSCGGEFSFSFRGVRKVFHLNAIVGEHLNKDRRRVCPTITVKAHPVVDPAGRWRNLGWVG